ncbi:hypothetical protein [Winogradskya humida]|uniref:Glycerophosphoryl diester phosphodiesterase family protein n=1 Tax=Winogradskya humida TaxID=113566 RepID=A0ABQ4A2Z9_9ACTN|nr:hypothetical protein [Actinoplanes humidus]GIE25230.1 hypothetical protein Ahu01nite_083320 [Actinoplanes humidus]
MSASFAADPNDPLVSTDFVGWWRRSFALLPATWKPLALINGIVAAAGTIVSVPALVQFGVTQRQIEDELARRGPGADIDLQPYLSGFGAVFALIPVTGLLYLIGSLFSVAVVLAAATGHTTNLRPAPTGAAQTSPAQTGTAQTSPALIRIALTSATRRLPALVGWSILAFVLGVVAFGLCFLPVIYVGAVLTVLPVVVLVERTNAIGRCFTLFHADFGVAISRVSTIGGLTVAGGLVTELLDLVAAAVFSGTTSTGYAITAAVLQGIFWFAAGIVLTPLLLTAYADMRARHEPFATATLTP